MLTLSRMPPMMPRLIGMFGVAAKMFRVGCRGFLEGIDRGSSRCLGLGVRTATREARRAAKHSRPWPRLWHDAWMSFYMMMSPLFTRDAGDWIAMAQYSYGVPHQTPPERDFPTIGQVLSAFRQANCHGWAYVRVREASASVDLPPCPDPAACAGGSAAA